MLDLLTDPIVLAVLIGPIAGIVWTKTLNADSRNSEGLSKGHVSVVQSLKGQGLKAYVEAIRLDHLPFHIIVTAISQAGALFLTVFASHAIRTTPPEHRFTNNLQKIGVMVIALVMPLYLLNFEVVNAQIINFIGEAI
ncbi:hypothetical protein [Vibrio brasiliensis]